VCDIKIVLEDTMLNKVAKDIATEIVMTMDSINRSRKMPTTDLQNWQSGRIAGLHHALYAVMLVGRE
jgi:hypothetical protein